MLQLELAQRQNLTTQWPTQCHVDLHSQPTVHSQSQFQFVPSSRRDYLRQPRSTRNRSCRDQFKIQPVVVTRKNINSKQFQFCISLSRACNDIDICRPVSMSEHNHEDPLDSSLNGNNEATQNNTSTNSTNLSPPLIDTVTTNKFSNLFKISYILRGILLTIQAIQLHVVEAAFQIIIVMEQTLFRTKVGTPHKVNVLKNQSKMTKKWFKRNPILISVFQDLACGIFKQEKWRDQVISGTIRTENLESHNVTKVNKELY